MRRFFIVFCCIMSFVLFGCGNGNSENASNTTETTPNRVKQVLNGEREVYAHQIKKPIPKGFKPVNVLNKVLYVPVEFKSIDASYQISAQGTNAGMALTGSILKKDADVKDALAKFYDLAVFYEKNEILRSMKPYEEAEVLEVLLKNMLETFNPKSARLDRIVSKEICENIDGHLYLKVVMSLKSTKKPKYDSMEHIAIYIFDDTIYFITSSPLVIANGVYDKEIDTIFDTFGCYLE